jgi:hypothetical protein
MTLQPLHSSNIARFGGYIYSLNHPDKGFTFFYSLCIYILILREFIIHKQEQTLLFLEFKTHSLIYNNPFIKNH